MLPILLSSCVVRLCYRVGHHSLVLGECRSSVHRGRNRTHRLCLDGLEMLVF